MAEITSLHIIRFSGISRKLAHKFSLVNPFSGQYVSKTTSISPPGMISGSVQSLVLHKDEQAHHDLCGHMPPGECHTDCMGIFRSWNS